jgi:hypothetical protein
MYGDFKIFIACFGLGYQIYENVKYFILHMQEDDFLIGLEQLKKLFPSHMMYQTLKGLLKREVNVLRLRTS